MSKVWLNGKMSKVEMIDEHPLEYEEILKQRNDKKESKNDEKV
jgi:hypothetical protein